MSRWKAALVHLSISAAVGLVTAGLIFGVWYPPPYSHAAGADELVLLLLGVDVVLGPLLTLVLFRAGKKGLRFDLTLIVLMQVCAFSYGLSVVVRARPAFVVGAVDRFVLVTANDLDPADLAAARDPRFRYVGWTGPRLVGAEMPTDVKEKNDLLFSGAAGKDVEKFPKYYVDYRQVAPALLGRARPLAELQKRLPAASGPISDWLRAHRRDGNGIVWLPLTSQRATLTMLLEARSGDVLGALPLDPW